MIENLRKYTGLMIVALVLVFAGLVLFVDTGVLTGRNRGATVMRIHGRGYSLQDYHQLGDYSANVAQMLNMYNLLGQLGGNPFQPDVEQFFINRVLLDRAQDEFGVHPSEEQVSRFIREKSAFAPEGKFNENLYSDFIQKRIGRFGLSEGDVRELFRDQLAVEKLFEVVGTGLLGNFDYNQRAYAAENQRVTVNLTQFDLATYEAKQNPEEAKVKEFWEESKDAYKTEPRRKFSYLLVSPKYPAAAPGGKPAEQPEAKPEGSPATTPASEPASEPAKPAPPAAPETTPPAPAPPASTPPPAAPSEPASTPPASSGSSESSQSPEPAARADTAKPSETAPAETTPATPAPAETPAPATPAPAETPAPAPAPAAVPATAPAPTPAPAPAAEAPKPDPAKAAEEAAKAAKAAAEAEARRKIDRALAESVDNFLGMLEDSQGGEFETLAKDNGWEIKKTDFCTRSSLPKELDLPVRSSGQRGQTVADFLFGMAVTADPLSKFTPAIPVGEGQWLIARLDEEEKEAVKPYEQARDEARAQLIERLAKDAMKSEAENAAKLIREAVQGGKTFEEAAKGLNLTARKLGPFTNRDQPAGETDAQAVFQHVATADPGTIPDVLVQNERALVVQVVAREIVKEENLQARIQSQVNTESSRNQYAAFQAWLAELRNAANVQQPARGQQ